MKSLSSLAEKYISDGMFPGCVVTCGDKSGHFGIKAFGLAEREPNERTMREDSIFDIASVSKIVATATSIGQMLDKKLLTLDTPASELLPEYKSHFADGLTVKHLATHTSGFDNKKPDANLKGDAVIEDWLHINPVAPTNTQYVYACKNIVMLSLIVERLSGENFGDYCRQNIFTPLKMKDTCFGPVPKSERIVRCGPGEVGTISDEPSCAIGRPVGNAGVFTTANDLTRFCRMMLNNGELDGARILSEAAVKTLTTVHSPDGLPEQGVCWKMYKNPDDYDRRPESLSKATFFHGGYTGQSVWIDPQKAVFVIVLTNRLHSHMRDRCPDWAKFLTDTNVARAHIGEAALAQMPS